MTNPLLAPFTLPPFSQIEPKHIVPAIKEILRNCRKKVEEVIKAGRPYSWNNLVQPLDDIHDYLNRIFSIINHLNSTKNSLELRKAYEQALPLLSEYNTWLGQNKDLYRAYWNLKQSDVYTTFNLAQKKSIDNKLRDFELSGVKLNNVQQKRYAEISTSLANLSSLYSNNLLDSTMAWSKLITNKAELVGIPENILAKTKKQAEAKGQNGWLLTLDHPSYVGVMNYCDNAHLRKEMYFAYSTRASDKGPYARKWDNTPIMVEQLILRHELAKLLGFNCYADKSLITKMAQHSCKVMTFLTGLVKRVRPQAEKEFDQLHKFVKKNFGIDKVQPWDFDYFSEKQKHSFYNISDEQLRPYFPEVFVLKGLFEIVKRIYSILIKERIDIDLYHAEVRFFDIFDDSDNLLGSFYLDLYARENKRGGAWMDTCINRMRKGDGSLQKPVAYITCNFNGPVYDKPALFTHNEVITLFHEFGHGLHHILSRIEVLGVSGLDGIPWDAIELPSQLMENWCWEPEAIRLISGHYETGESLPSTLLNKILLLKNYQAALFILRQLEFSIFDFRLHIECNPKTGVQILETLWEVKKQVSVIPNLEWTRFPHSFSHIFSGGYAAGYYSYLWANVLSSDVYSRFLEEGIFNHQTGQSFLDNILTCGGVEEPIVLFKRFRGREPNPEEMLKYYGL
ncbi:oligopeptidase A [Candidatus Pantoea carbekii]|uniref:oligopeptidase A n=1 Tax=Candidatus Pantoea carbekii TaxID=1235990 RepID=UPI000618790F|nr:oligopeptidase A [Candidatus Pantoea carbekii]AKC32451.1 oligopeptidase A PrlC [Candidatus Pantoea carbekii]